MAESITAVTMPKLGMTMTEGKVASWVAEVGAEVEEGDEIFDVETSKITNAHEAPASGVFRRRVVEEGDTLPVGALVGIIADASISDADIDAFIADFEASMPARDAAEAGAT